MRPAHLAFGLAAILAIAACADLPNDTRPRGIETAKRTDGGSDGCDLGAYRVYRPTPHKDKEAPYDAVIPPDYDAPSRVPSSCKRLPD